MYVGHIVRQTAIEWQWRRTNGQDVKLIRLAPINKCPWCFVRALRRILWRPAELLAIESHTCLHCRTGSLIRIKLVMFSFQLFLRFELLIPDVAEFSSEFSSKFTVLNLKALSISASE